MSADKKQRARQGARAKVGNVESQDERTLPVTPDKQAVGTYAGNEPTSGLAKRMRQRALERQLLSSK